VELQIPAAAVAGNRIYFQDQPILRSQSGTIVRIQTIEAFSAQALTLSPLSGVAVATAAALRNAVLVLNVGGYEDLQGIPLAALNHVYAENGANFVPFVHEIFTLDDLYKIDWTKSYVQLTAGTGALYAYVFGVRYTSTPLGRQDTRI